jgi:signal transduction histidine kinase
MPEPMTAFSPGKQIVLDDAIFGSTVDLANERLAHDLNNVFQIISGNLDLLVRKCEHDGDAQRYLRSARVGLELGNALARHVLAASPVLISAECPLKDLLQGFDELIRDAAGPRIDVSLRMGEGLPAVAGDACALKNAVLNLVINARDAIIGDGTIAVSFDVDPADDALLVTVLDSGRGIDDDALSRIFEPYHSTKAPGCGTGLGLATVAAFARNAGAELRVETCLGTGSRFALRIPTLSSATLEKGAGR